MSSKNPLSEVEKNFINDTLKNKEVTQKLDNLLLFDMMMSKGRMPNALKLLLFVWWN